MTLKALKYARMMFVSIQEAMPEMEVSIALVQDQAKRNKLVTQLALLDQRMAELRDKVGFAYATGFSG